MTPQPTVNAMDLRAVEDIFGGAAMTRMSRKGKKP